MVILVFLLATAAYPDPPNFGKPKKCCRRILESRSAAEKNPAKFGWVGLCRKKLQLCRWQFSHKETL